MDNIIIAIDGPAGAGKSTISKLVANRLGINYIDTGAMYRALTLKCLENDVDIEDESQVISMCETSDISFEDNVIYLDKRDVSSLIRSQSINKNVSNVAKIEDVRKKMVEKQRLLGLDKDVILDGRDVGTYIFPDTKFKFYLNASPEERGKRRYDEMVLKGENVVLDDIIEDVRKRDEIDSKREFAPLVKAHDALEIDSTDMSIEEVVDFIVSKVDENR